MRTTSGCRGRVLCALVWAFILGSIALFVGAAPALGDEPVGAGRLDGGKRGAVRRWGAGMSVGPYSEVNLKTGRVLTTLPVVGWSGVGPAVSFSLYHNPPLWADPTGPTTPSMLGDANLDGGVDEADTEDFVAVLLDPEPDAEEVAVCDFDRNESADETDLGRFGELLASGEADVGRWSHSYSRRLDLSSLPDWLVVVWDDGTEDVYEPDGVGGWTPPPGVFNALSDDGAGGYLLTSKHRDLMRFDESGRLDWVEDAAGNRLTCAYGQTVGAPDYRKLIYVTDAANRSLTLAYNDHGLLETITDPISRTWICLYEDAEHPGEPSSEADGPFVRFTDPGDHSVNWTYDDGNIVQLWDPSLDPASDDPWTYAFVGEQLTTVTDPLGLTQSFAYWPDAYPRPTKIQARYTDRRGSLWRYWIKYSTGNLERWMDPLNHEQRFTYGDARPQLSHERTAYRNAVSKTWTAAYDDVANVDFAADPLGNRWSFDYDERNNLTSVTPPGDVPGTGNADKIVAYVYGDENFPTSVTGITLPADGQGNPATTIALTYWGQDPEDPATSYGLLKSVTDANGVGTLYEYDHYGQLWRTSEGSLGWDIGTRVIDTALPDRVGRIRWVLEHYVDPHPSDQDPPGGGGERMCYVGGCISPDECSNAVGFICCCPYGHHWNDGDPQGQGGEPPAGGGGGREAFWDFDCEPNPVGTGIGNSFLNLFFSPTSREASAIGAFTDNSLVGGPHFNVSASQHYDPLGRLDLSTLTTSEPSYLSGSYLTQDVTRDFSYAYDDESGVFDRTGPDGQLTHVQTDVAGRVTSVTRSSLSAAYTYTNSDQVATVTYGDGSRTVYAYDDAGRQTSIRHEWASDHSVIVQMVYAYSADGLITDVTETGPQGWSAAVHYEYDNRNRLIEEERTGTHPYHRMYTYDPGGNRLTKTDGLASERTVYHYDLEDPQQYGSLNNRLLFSELFDESGLEPVLIEKVYYEYDIEGRATLIVRETIEAGQPTMYHATDLQYNKQGELWFVTRRHWEAGDAYCEQQVIDQILEVRGSGRARHVARERDPAAFDWIVPDTAVWSDYDGDTIYGDYTAEWVEVQPDVWELEVEDRTAYLPGIGQMDNATGEVMYTHGDQVGSLRAVTRCAVGAQECIPGETASVLQRPVYTAFGELVYDLAPLDTFIRYRYAGDWGYEGRLGSETNGGSDSALGLPYTHVGHRWYDPSTGRFLQRDPIGIRGGINVYAYASSNPLRCVDPSGLEINMEMEIYVNTTPPPLPPYTGGDVVTNRPVALPPAPTPVPPAASTAACTSLESVSKTIGRIKCAEGFPAMLEGALIADVVTSIFVYPMQLVGLVDEDAYEPFEITSTVCHETYRVVCGE